MAITNVVTHFVTKSGETYFTDKQEITVRHRLAGNTTATIPLQGSDESHFMGGIHDALIYVRVYHPETKRTEYIMPHDIARFVLYPKRSSGF